MKYVSTTITLTELKEMSQLMFGDLVKAVVDIEKKVMVVDAELHADEEKYLLEHGSSQDNVWGINIYPELEGDEFIEFDSMINMRPRLHNLSRSVEDSNLQQKIRDVVNVLIMR